MGGGMGGRAGGRADGMGLGMGGFAKVDNRFGYEKWLQGGSIGLALVWSKIKKLKFALSFASPEKEKYFLFIYEVITWGKRKKSSAIQ